MSGRGLAKIEIAADRNATSGGDIANRSKPLCSENEAAVGCGLRRRHVVNRCQPGNCSPSAPHFC
jgi:hypothetical protein